MSRVAFDVPSVAFELGQSKRACKCSQRDEMEMTMKRKKMTSITAGQQGRGLDVIRVSNTFHGDANKI